MAARRGGWNRDKAKEQHWRRMVRAWRRSGLSVCDFCDWQNISQASFYAWRREIALRERETVADENAAAVTAPPAFVPVQVVADVEDMARHPGCYLEVRLPSGAQLRVPAGFDRQTLIHVLAALEGAPSC